MKRRNFYGFCVAGILAAVLASIAAGQAANGAGITPYRFERVNEHNFHSQGWQEQEVNMIPGVGTQFADESAHLSIVCGPDDDSDPRLIKGSVTMNLPTSAFPTLRRIRLRRGGYSGTFLADLREVKYSTYLVHGGPTAMVLQVDVNGDEAKDFNIFFAPEEQGIDHPVLYNVWQQWNALHGNWVVEASTVPGLSNGTELTIGALTAQFASARIIDTPPIGNNGEGVRFTVGPPALYPNNVSYFDALIIGTADRQRSTLFDFTCNSSDQN